MRRPLQIAHDMAKLVLRARRSGRRRRGRRESARLRRHDTERRADPSLHVRAGTASRTGTRPRACARAVEGLPDIHEREPGSWRETRDRVAEPARDHARARRPRRRVRLPRAQAAVGGRPGRFSPRSRYDRSCQLMSPRRSGSGRVLTARRSAPKISRPQERSRSRSMRPPVGTSRSFRPTRSWAPTGTRSCG